MSIWAGKRRLIESCHRCEIMGLSTFTVCLSCIATTCGRTVSLISRNATVRHFDRANTRHGSDVAQKPMVGSRRHSFVSPRRRTSRLHASSIGLARRWRLHQSARTHAEKKCSREVYLGSLEEGQRDNRLPRRFDSGQSTPDFIVGSDS